MPSHLNPGMLKDLVGCVPFLGVHHQQMSHQIFGSIRDVVPVRGKELELAQLDDVEELILVPLGASERGEATQEDVENHACSPHVHLQAVTFLRKNFRSYICGRPTHSKYRPHHMFGQAKISQLQGGRLVFISLNQKVFRFQIPVHDLLVVHVDEGLASL